MRSPTPPERVRFLPSVLHTPRSSSRPGCRSLTPVTRVRTPLGALLDATVVSGRKHTALPAPRTGFESRRSLHGALGGQDGGLHPPERGSIPRGSTVSRRAPEGVPCRGPQLPRDTTARLWSQAHALARAWWRGSAVSRVGRVRLPSRALTRRSSADRAPPCDGGGRRFESSRRDMTTTGRLGRRRSDMAVERGSIPRSSISP
jgi:hypothetical protein